MNFRTDVLVTVDLTDRATSWTEIGAKKPTPKITAIAERTVIASLVQKENRGIP